MSSSVVGTLLRWVSSHFLRVTFLASDDESLWWSWILEKMKHDSLCDIEVWWPAVENVSTCAVTLYCSISNMICECWTCSHASSVQCWICCVLHIACILCGREVLHHLISHQWLYLYRYLYLVAPIHLQQRQIHSRKPSHYIQIKLQSLYQNTLQEMCMQWQEGTFSLIWTDSLRRQHIIFEPMVTWLQKVIMKSMGGGLCPNTHVCSFPATRVTGYMHVMSVFECVPLYVVKLALSKQTFV